MKDSIVTSLEPVLLVGGGWVGANDLTLAQSFAPTLVAADGGVETILAAGLMPEAVIGDFDSLSDRARELVPDDRQFRIAEQDSTDFDKALRNIDSPLVIGVGFTGARMDHQMAALNVLARYPGRRVILISEHEVIWHVQPRQELAVEAGDTVSLMPFGPVRGRSSGLQWPIEGIDFAPGGRIGTSNRATGRVRLEMEQAGMLGFIPRERCSVLVTALLGLPVDGLWSSHA